MGRRAEVDYVIWSMGGVLQVQELLQIIPKSQDIAACNLSEGFSPE